MLLDDRQLNQASSREPSKIVSILYAPIGVRAYHLHEMGKSWVPTAPEQARGASSIEVQSLSVDYFVSNLPRIILKNTLMKRWFPVETVVSSYSIEGENVTIELNQRQTIEGVGRFEIGGKLSRPLSFLDGDAVLEVTMTDYFGFGRKLRIYHDGHSEAKLGLQHSERFNPVTCIACDGVRERFLYRCNRTDIQMATIYLRDPSSLYSLANPDIDAQTRPLIQDLRPDFVLGVNPVRTLEWTILDHGSAYDHGTIGAEVAYLVASKMLMTDQLLMLEPAMRGSDLVSRDRRIAVEARMLAGVKPKTAACVRREAGPHLKQMMGRLRWGLSRKVFKRGVAILCLRLREREIIALVKEA